jgi:hypothetical protein
MDAVVEIILVKNWLEVLEALYFLQNFVQVLQSFFFFFRGSGFEFDQPSLVEFLGPE